jgi:hypothetical protein
MMQRQGPAHGFVALQLPLQVPIGLAFVCNCRAETVPAHKTATVIAARNVFLKVFLPIIALLSFHRKPDDSFTHLCSLDCKQKRVEALLDAS